MLTHHIDQTHLRHDLAHWEDGEEVTLTFKRQSHYKWIGSWGVTFFYIGALAGILIFSGGN